jgi:hypothetical protein
MMSVDRSESKMTVTCRRWRGLGRELLGSVVIDPIVAEEAYDVLLSGSRLASADRIEILARYLKRNSFRRQRSGQSSDYDAPTSVITDLMMEASK